MHTCPWLPYVCPLPRWLRKPFGNQIVAYPLLTREGSWIWIMSVRRTPARPRLRRLSRRIMMMRTKSLSPNTISTLTGKEPKLRSLVTSKICWQLVHHHQGLDPLLDCRRQDVEGINFLPAHAQICKVFLLSQFYNLGKQAHQPQLPFVMIRYDKKMMAGDKRLIVDHVASTHGLWFNMDNVWSLTDPTCTEVELVLYDMYPWYRNLWNCWPSRLHM